MAATLSRTQIDRLGERLREGSPTEPDLRLLDDYRRSFGATYEAVIRTIREQLQLEPTGRPAKSTGSLIEKLHRESIRLSQVQDIAGCRVVVTDVAAQERVVESLRNVFPGASVVDRRANPSYGYRAVHVIVQISGKLIEIQVRSSLQHLWAELSEKFSDVVDPTIKYGAGPHEIQEMLTKASGTVAIFEELEAEVGTRVARLAGEELHQQQRRGLGELQQEMINTKREIGNQLNEMISWVES